MDSLHEVYTKFTGGIENDFSTCYILSAMVSKGIKKQEFVYETKWCVNARIQSAG